MRLPRRSYRKNPHLAYIRGQAQTASSMQWLMRYLKDHYRKLHEIRDAPHAVAGGAAIGMFWGFTPLTGLKTLLSLVFAWAFRCSKLSAVIAVTFHDVLTPVWPIVLRWEYDLGFWILSNPHRFPHRLKISDLNWADWFRLKTLELLWPTFLGSLVIAIPTSALSYILVKWSIEKYQKRHHVSLTPPA